jgi:ring-1,2-phenylacetyl-CoA epoxidase subunit PaaE
MNDEAEAALLAAGVPRTHPHRALRRARRCPPAPAAPSSTMAQPGDAEQARVVIIRDGMRREIDFRKDQPSILDAAFGRRAGGAVLLHLGCAAPAAAR